MRLDKGYPPSLPADSRPRCHRLLRFEGRRSRKSLYTADLHRGRYPLRSFVITGDTKEGALSGARQFIRLKRASHVALLPCFQVIPSPNMFLDECEALVSISIDGGTLAENQLRDLLSSFGHLQSFYPSSGVCFPPTHLLLMPDRSVSLHLSPILQSIPILDVPICSSTTCMTFVSLALVSALNLAARKSSLRI